MREPIFPAEFTATVDAAVAHVLDGAPQPAGLESLVAWIGENYWDVPEGEDSHDTYIDISALASRDFYDYEVRDWMNLSEAVPVNDEMRFEFAKHAMSRALEDFESGGAFVSYPLLDSKGRSAVLGTLFTTAFYPGGLHVRFLGIFRDWQELLEEVARRGLWFGDKLHNPDKAEVLAQWVRDESGRS